MCFCFGVFLGDYINHHVAVELITIVGFLVAEEALFLQVEAVKIHLNLLNPVVS